MTCKNRKFPLHHKFDKQPKRFPTRDKTKIFHLDDIKENPPSLIIARKVRSLHWKSLARRRNGRGKNFCIVTSSCKIGCLILSATIVLPRGGEIHLLCQTQKMSQSERGEYTPPSRHSNSWFTELSTVLGKLRQFGSSRNVSGSAHKLGRVRQSPKVSYSALHCEPRHNCIMLRSPEELVFRCVNWILGTVSLSVLEVYVSSVACYAWTYRD